MEEIQRTGSYQLTSAELSYGAKLAWRNSVRCLGRFFWTKLDVLDLRAARDEAEIYQGCLRHLQHATHHGDIRSTITIFPPDQPGQPGPRIWNHQLARYAGYRGRGAQVLGDPAEADFTDLCLRLGWKSPQPRSPFDLLPLVISWKKPKPQLFPAPHSFVHQVPLRHPECRAFSTLHLRWYAVPIVSDMALEIGGLRFPAAPFSGWYVGTEIGARNLGDSQRYDLLPKVARVFRLDTSHAATLWKDRALVELNRAVLFSFKKAGVRLLDHHSASASHLQFEKEEKKAGRPVQGRWDWLIPPLSGSASPLWNRSYDPTEFSPNFTYQKKPY